jgi:prepilin-type N-terminal cleavage/methylation domain-containing protein
MRLKTRKSISGRAGFSLGEVLVAVAIVAVAAAVTIPVVFNKMRSSQEAALSQTFVGLSQGIAEFKRATTRYPELLQYLTEKPLDTDDDICNNDLGVTNVSFWRGPYASRTITASGLLVGEYTVSNTLRFGNAASGLDTLYIDVPSVEAAVVNDIESQFDAGAASGTAGTIQYTAPVSGVSTLSYLILINSC